jgi:hypothetical protein
MHLGWSLDERPRWAVALVFQVLGDSPGRPGAHRLEDAIAVTGKARVPGVRFGGGEVRVTVLVKGADDVEATAAALAVLDSAVRQVPGVVLGDLLSHAARQRLSSV